MSLVKCTRSGCGQEFDSNQNQTSDCVFHPGNPVFHEGMKSWSCCKTVNKPVLEFDQFIKIKGSPPKPTSQITSNQINSSATDSKEKPKEKVEVKELEDDPESIVPKGSKCKRLTCGQEWKSEVDSKRGELNHDECTYHPGTPIFHEGSKGYSCCKKRVLDFDEFLKISGFQTFNPDDQEEIINCRFDYYQTPTSVIVSVFGKGAIKDHSEVIFENQVMKVNLKLPGNKRFDKSFKLFGKINTTESTYKILSTKCEIILVKLDGISWSNLEEGDNFAGTVTFGVGGRTGTVGAKEIAI
ncbi:HSP20-like chaperone [Melampsora americana]|nr:HSP20-like chaperone [Melampsora americana]